MGDAVIAVEVLAAAVFGLAAGWFLWGRQLTEAQGEVARQREERGRHATEVQFLQAENAKLTAAERERELLAGELSALKAQQAERDRAHMAELARLNEGFEALATKAMAAAQTKLAEAAEGMLTRHREAAGAGLEANRNQLAEMITPMKETLAKYEARLGEVEAARAESYGKLQQQLEQVVLGQSQVGNAARKLETALRTSGKVAGRWGEEQCRNVLEAAGLVEGIDFETQSSFETEAGRQQRPDFIIRLPGGRVLVVDVKCSVDSYIEAVETDDPQARTVLLAAHAKALRGHADGLARKDYAKTVGDAVEFVVLFVPGENFLSAAVEQDRALMTEYFNKKVVLAGPVNLVAVARTVAALRDQARLAREAAEIARLGRDLYDSLRIMGGNMVKVQRSLEQTVTNWNTLVSQAENRVMGRARRLKEHGVATGIDDIPEMAPVAALPVPPSASELALTALPPADAAE
jgi:DNA recombination protein RmuC